MEHLKFIANLAKNTTHQSVRNECIDYMFNCIAKTEGRLVNGFLVPNHIVLEAKNLMLQDRKIQAVKLIRDASAKNENEKLSILESKKFAESLIS